MNILSMPLYLLRVLLMTSLTLFGLTACGGGGSSDGGNSGNGGGSVLTLRSVTISPLTPSLAKGNSLQGKATATFSDNTTQDVTSLATWASSSPAVATASNAADSRGLFKAVSVGTTTVSATFQNVTGSTTLTVTNAELVSIEVTPANSSLAKGNSAQFTATGVYSDNTNQNITKLVTWSSDKTAVASVSNDASTRGTVKGLTQGTATIKATSGSISGSTTATVTAAVLKSLQVTPATVSRAKGATQQFTATGTFSDQSTQDVTSMVTWSSSKTTVATISNADGSRGLAATLAEGAATITAASGSITSTAALTVTAAALSRIEVTPAQPSIPVGTSQQFTATGVYTDNTMQDLTATATWASSDTGVLEVSNTDGQRGFAVANKLGTATISASAMDVTGSTAATVSAATLTTIQVTPANKSLAKGFSLQYTATGTYSDNSNRDITKQVTWESSNPGLATISNADGSHGLATAGTAAGTVTIKATSGTLTGTTSLIVSDVTLSSITVTPTNPTLPKGTMRQFTATANFTGGSTQDVTSQANWSSAAPTVATVSNEAGSKGLVSAVAATGSSAITATISNAVVTTPQSGSSNVTVTAATLTAIQVTPPTPSVAKGKKQAFAAMGTYSDGTSNDITTTVNWSSSSTAVATISNASPDYGTATVAGTGNTTITATLNTVSSTASLTGTAAELVSIAVTPTNASVAAGRTQQFVATGTYTDATTQIITTAVTWASSDNTVATISNVDGSRGLASSTKKGSSNITAASGSIASPAVVFTVTDAVPVSLAVTPATQTIGNKDTQQYKATETFSDGTTADQTTAVNWSSSNTAVVDISNATGSKGLATSKTQGMTTITATDSSVTPGITATASLTVGAAALQSIAVTTTNASLPPGYRVQYTAVGSYSDGSSKDITTAVSWSTLNTAIATVSNTAGSNGEVTTVASGTTSVRATLNGVNGSAQITVNGASLSSITVTPPNQTVGGGDTVQYKAVATFSDRTTLDVTRQVTWASSSTTAATVDQNGLATGATGGTSFTGGTTTISATKGTTRGSVTLTRSPGA